ncbi:hypothetical protein COCON_G00072460, partial [Conger conger]
ERERERGGERERERERGDRERERRRTGTVLPCGGLGCLVSPPVLGGLPYRTPAHPTMVGDLFLWGFCCLRLWKREKKVAGEQKYHPECFTCLGCGSFIGDGDTYALVERSKLYCGHCYYRNIVTPVTLPDSTCRIPHTVTLVSIPASVDGKRGLSVSIDNDCSPGNRAPDSNPTVRVSELDSDCISPDVKSSVHVGDRILEINGTPIRNVPLDEIDLLIQETGRLLQLTIEHDPHDRGRGEGPALPTETPSPIRPTLTVPTSLDLCNLRSRAITRSSSIDKSPCSSGAASPLSQKKDIGRSESLRVVSSDRTHRIFRPSDLIHGRSWGRAASGRPSR